MKPKNIKQAKALIKRYRTITYGEIKQMSYNVHYFRSVAHMLTGFGGMSTCTLCNAVNAKCSDCIHAVPVNTDILHCLQYDSKETYNGISLASNTEQLLTAFRKRADYLEKLVSKFENQKP